MEFKKYLSCEGNPHCENASYSLVCKLELNEIQNSIVQAFNQQVAHINQDNDGLFQPSIEKYGPNYMIKPQLALGNPIHNMTILLDLIEGGCLVNLKSDFRGDSSLLEKSIIRGKLYSNNNPKNPRILSSLIEFDTQALLETYLKCDEDYKSWDSLKKRNGLCFHSSPEKNISEIESAIRNPKTEPKSGAAFVELLEDILYASTPGNGGYRDDLRKKEKYYFRLRESKE